MKRTIKLNILKLFKIPYCQKCISANLESGYWIRGKDPIHSGAIGDRGTRCYDCGYILWDQTEESFREGLLRNGHTHMVVFKGGDKYQDGNLLPREELKEMSREENLQKIRTGECVSELTADRCPYCIDTCLAFKYGMRGGLVGRRVLVEGSDFELESIGFSVGYAEDYLKSPLQGTVTKDYNDSYVEVEMEIKEEFEPFLNKKSQRYSILKSMLKLVDE